MSVKQYIKRGLRFVLFGVPVKNIRADISYSQPNLRLQGRKIIITGGGKGLGAAMAAKFTAEGASVLIAGRDEAQLKTTAERIGCSYWPLDVQDPSSFTPFLENADNILDGADSLVNNAGISLHEPTFFDVTPESFDAQIATNFRGPFFLTQSFTRRLLEKSGMAISFLFLRKREKPSISAPMGLPRQLLTAWCRGWPVSLFRKASASMR